MKVLCIVSEFSGHIDFGGMGFLRLAEAMKNQGHEIIWAAPPVHLSTLVKCGFNKYSFTETAALHIRPFFTTQLLSKHSKEFITRIELIKKLYIEIKLISPDIILLDRVLQIGFLISEQLQIPSVSVGSPGGYWSKSKAGVSMVATPIQDYVEVGEQIKDKLNWNKGRLTSLWGYSAYLNICFLGKSFYDCNQVANSAYVYHFDNRAEDTERHSFGISYGNSGPPEKMMQTLHCLMQIRQLFSSVEIFTGAQEQIYEALKRQLGNSANLHAWVKFSDYFYNMKGLAFFGGVGTVWECINYNVPMFVVPTIVGDQARNANAIERLGLGRCIDATNNKDEIVEIIQKTLCAGTYLGNIKEFKKRENYTDTMDTTVDKIAGLR
ncbi:MAG: hypothetical protein L3J24_03900 [Xanthomonadales bacterium]|nr:hypothetical protein [Xanthomonadales bacterium]